MNMRKIVLAAFAALFLCVNANAAEVLISKVAVPFDFTVHGYAMPAGTYRIVHPDNAPGLLILRNLETGRVVSTLSFPEGRNPAQARLVFDNATGNNVLSAVVTNSTYLTVTPLHKARMIAKSRMSDDAGGR